MKKLLIVNLAVWSSFSIAQASNNEDFSNIFSTLRIDRSEEKNSFDWKNEQEKFKNYSSKAFNILADNCPKEYNLYEFNLPYTNNRDESVAIHLMENISRPIGEIESLYKEGNKARAWLKLAEIFLKDNQFYFPNLNKMAKRGMNCLEYSLEYNKFTNEKENSFSEKQVAKIKGTLGNMYIHLEVPRYKEGVKLLKEAGELDSEALNNLGALYMDLLKRPNNPYKDTNKAIKYYKKAAKMGDSSALFNLGSALYEQKDFEQARIYFDLCYKSENEETKMPSKIRLEELDKMEKINKEKSNNTNQERPKKDSKNNFLGFKKGFLNNK